MGASLVNKFCSLFTFNGATMEGDFRKFCYCLYCCKSSVLSWPTLELLSSKSALGCPGDITFSEKIYKILL